MQPDDRRPPEPSPDLASKYDYIVVGSGAGGGPLAANLAEAGYRVLLMEAGTDSEDFDYQVPAFHTAASEHPEMSWAFFVRHYADDGQQSRDAKYSPDRRGVFYPRAGTLGGCTAHHAMILLCPNNSDWEEIARITGDPAWGPERMRRYFTRIENCRYRFVQRLLQRVLRWNPSRHGFDGWLQTEKASLFMLFKDRVMLRIVKRAVLTALSASRNPLRQVWHSLVGLFDPNDWSLVSREGVGMRFTPLSTSGGRRVSSRSRIQAVRRAHPDRLHVMPGALATRVLLDGDKRAVGVEYLLGEHLYGADPLHRSAEGLERQRVDATREVILAGGAFNTPQLLQLSGIGPAELLERRGIPLAVDLPGVGANLQDRYEVTVVNRMREPFKLLEGATMRAPGPGETPDPQFRLWEQGRGPYTTNGAVASIIYRSSVAEAAQAPPDLVLFGLVTNFRGYFPGYSQEVQAARQDFSWAVLKAQTNNRAGTVQIRSDDPTEPPEINFHYFEEGSPGHEEDLEAVVEGVELVRRIMDGLGDVVAEETSPGPQVRGADLTTFVRDQAWGHHASCTCKIGADDDPDAVLDGQFRVRGTEGLRVVDASVFPRAPGLFIASAILMIAEKATDDILTTARGG